MTPPSPHWRLPFPSLTDGRPVVKAGIRFSTETLAVEDWEME